MAGEAKQLQSIPLDTIGVNGLDTQTNPTALGPNWFTKAHNITYTEGGKVTFRKGLKQGTLNAGAAIGAIHEHYNGTEHLIFGAVDGDIYEVDLTDKDNAWINPYNSAVSTADWQFVNFNNHCFAFQSGAEYIHYDTSVTPNVWDLGRNDSGYTAPSGVTTFDPSCGLGFYGRLWVGGITEEPDVVFYTNVLGNHKWGSSGSGYIDLKSVWGHDIIVAIKAFAGKLAIFGEENIVLYNNPQDPSSADFALDEVIRGIGCVSRDSIQEIGDDLYFMSKTGVRSLARTAQLDKLPLTEKSITIKDDLIDHIINDTTIKSVYVQDEGLYIVSFVNRKATYVFDTKFITEKRTPRVTSWDWRDGRNPSSLAYTQTYGLLVGQSSGRIATYEGYYDVDYSGSGVYTYTPYTGSFSTTWIDLGQGVLSSILKKLILVVSGGQGTDVGLRMYRDFDTTPKLSRTFKLNPAFSGSPAYWGKADSLYATSKFQPIYGLKETSIPLANTAKYLRLEMDGVTKGYKASLQSLSLLFKKGKIL